MEHGAKFAHQFLQGTGSAEGKCMKTLHRSNSSSLTLGSGAANESYTSDMQ